MCPKTVTQNKVIREERRSHILKVALNIFGDEGYHASSINRIAKEANISKGLIYTYFESKEDLLKTLIFDLTDSILEKYPNEDNSLESSDIEFFIDNTIDFVLEDISRAKLLFSLGAQPGVMDIIIQKVMEKMLPFMNLITNYFKKNKVEDAHAMMYYFFSVLDGVQMQMINNPNFPTEKIRTIIKKQFLK
tara:strand:- start:64 stop:636 length:573 start_codon:yes stop_codon:yes gene_type:complete